MSKNRLQELHDVGQSIWLDFIERKILLDGELERRIREDALTGMTSNPTIFEKALGEGSAYDAQIGEDADGRTAWELFERIETMDVRTACDLFRPVYDATSAQDGYVSIEVSPGVANDANATTEEARRLWKTVDRPNLMVKVPGTEEGAKAVRALLTDGINVNITLLFAVAAHERVIDAFIDALEARAAKGQPIDRLASVASFFVSRVDSEADKRLDAQSANATGAKKDQFEQLKGKTAIANAKLAYALFKQKFSGPRWAALEAKGAHVQRPLWASTSTKNPAYRDVMYVEELIGPDTVNTMPPATIEAFRDHGAVTRTVDADLASAHAHIAALEAAGVSLDAVTSKLLSDGLASFQKSFEGLISGLEKKTASLGVALATGGDR